MKNLKNRLFKDDIERRAFSVLFFHLWKKGELSRKEAFKILSGVRFKHPQKINKQLMWMFLRKWHKEKLITLYHNSGKVRPALNPYVFARLDEDILAKIADESTNCWLKFAPHGLKKHEGRN